MDKKYITKTIPAILLSISMVLCQGLIKTSHASAKITPVILLSDYQKEMKIGEEYSLFAYSSDGRIPKFSSSDKKIATVDQYGKIIAKKAGKCTIIVKAFTTEAYCRLEVLKTQITLSSKSISIENNETVHLSVETSNNSVPVFKSNKKSIAVVDEDGNITGCKPGNAVITVKADGYSVNCKVTVRQPVIKLDRRYKRLYRCQRFKLNADVSSGIAPVWKSSRKSVATVDENGMVTAVKHGTAIITAKVDGISKSCEVVVEKPEIKLSDNKITLEAGSSFQIGMSISSGNAPVWSSSKENVASVDQLGNVYAITPGTTIITASEDGTKAKCTVKLISNE